MVRPPTTRPTRLRGRPPSLTSPSVVPRAKRLSAAARDGPARPAAIPGVRFQRYLGQPTDVWEFTQRSRVALVRRDLHH